MNKLKEEENRLKLAYGEVIFRKFEEYFEKKYEHDSWKKVYQSIKELEEAIR